MKGREINIPNNKYNLYMGVFNEQQPKYIEDSQGLETPVYEEKKIYLDPIHNEWLQRLDRKYNPLEGLIDIEMSNFMRKVQIDINKLTSRGVNIYTDNKIATFNIEDEMDWVSNGFLFSRFRYDYKVDKEDIYKRAFILHGISDKSLNEVCNTARSRIKSFINNL